VARAPFISVIVTAHNRRAYLLGAVRSALDQTLPRDLYEVIVVKNFREGAIDRELDRMGVVNLQSESAGLGAKVAEALDVASGDAISLLEDDDLFLPRKLETARRALLSGASYFHNGMLVMNGRGEYVGRSGDGSALAGDAAKYRHLEHLIRRGAWHNNSSVSVLRRPIEEERTVLASVELTLDLFLMLASLKRGGTLVWDPTPLTVFRIHGDQSMVKSASFEAWLRNRSAYSDRHARDLAILVHMMEGTPYELLAHRLFDRAKLAANYFGEIVDGRRRYALGPSGYASLALRPTVNRRDPIYYLFLLNSLMPPKVRRLGARYHFALETRHVG